MAKSYVSTNGTFIIPGAYTDIRVERDNSGLSATGVIMLVGEADAGPDATLETDINDNYFTASDLAAVIAKYQSGPIVDAVRALAAPANDPDIVGAVSRIYIAKTNVSTKASADMVRAGFSDYAILADKSWGDIGNYAFFNVTDSVSESAASFTTVFAPWSGTNSSLKIALNGAAATTVAITGNQAPAALVTSLNAVSNLLATGGIDRDVLSGWADVDTLAVAVSGNSITITGSVPFATTPTVGDLLIIPANTKFGAGADSVIKGAGSENLGVYVVTAATTTTITALKLRDANADTLTAPVAVNAVAIGADHVDIVVTSPVTVKNMTGTNRGSVATLAAVNATGTATGSSLRVVLATTYVWDVTPAVGDIVNLTDTTFGASNKGWFVVTDSGSGIAAGASFVEMTRLSDGSPASFLATALGSGKLVVYRPEIDGVGKSIEILDNAGAANINTLFFTTAGADVDWISTSTTPTIITSATERKARLTVTRQYDSASEELLAGGRVALRVGYFGTTATLTINAAGTSLTTSVTGGNGSNLTINLTKFSKLSDLAAYINAQTGYSCSLDTAIVGSLPPTALDRSTYNIIGQFLGSKPARIKADAYYLYKAVTNDSALAQLGTGTTPTQPVAGLPENQSNTFFSGGAKGATTNATISSALSLLEQVRGNFLVPLFSRDASEDIVDDLTDANSTYTIDAITAAARTHVLACSQVKRRRNRQAFLSEKGTFAVAKETANNLATPRASLAFQDFKVLDSAGDVTQFQPWMGAVLAAGMQAAGFYRSITNKTINASGVIQAAGDFADQNDSQLEDALLNGLLVARKHRTGGYRWVSDQTTYGVDSNFVYNSIQAVYAADVVALSVAERMETAFLGQSNADVTAGVAAAYLKAIMADMKRLKLIAASDDAPEGYKNVSIRISGNVMTISLEIKLATAIDFIPISMFVSRVESSATA